MKLIVADTYEEMSRLAADEIAAVANAADGGTRVAR